MCRLKGPPVPRSVTSHRLAECDVRRLVLGVAALLFLTTLPAWSQQPDGAAPEPAPPAADTAGVEQPAEPADEAPAAPDAPLPEGFTPPAAKPEYMTLRKPLLTQDEIRKEDGALRLQNVTSVLSSGDPSSANVEILRRWANLRVAELTAVDEWSKLSELTTPKILLPLRTAGGRQGNPNRVREFREALCKALTEACSKVLDNNFYVRMQAVRVLSELNVREEQVGNQNPPISYVPAMSPLLDVIGNPEQPEALKVMAAAGVARIANFADLIPAELKFRAADVLTKELAKGDTHWWYQARLAEAAAAIELEVDRTGNAVVVTSLLTVIADNNRHCMARSAAAKALGRTPLTPGKFDEKAAAARLAQLARDMSVAYNKQPKNVQWYECYLNLFLTFKVNVGENAANLPANCLIRRGSLPAPLNDAFQRITPIVKHVMNQPPNQQKAIPGEMIQQLAALLAANPQ